LHDGVTVLRSQYYSTTVMQPRWASMLVDLFTRRLAVPGGEIAVFGDMGQSRRNVPPHRICHRNGQRHLRVKALAHAVTSPTDEDGFAVAIDRYILGN
jgi:hypothetical protein